MSDLDPFPLEVFWYLLFGGIVQLLAALIVAPIFCAIGYFVLRKSVYHVLRAYLIFNGFLLFWGCLGNYACLRFALDKLYVSADRLVDWIPFIPFGQWILDQSLGPVHGHLIPPATLGELRWIWLAFAVPVWLLSYFSTVYVLHFPVFRIFPFRCEPKT
jgi:hypothetical protein